MIHKWLPESFVRHAEALGLVGDGDEDQISGPELHRLSSHDGGYESGGERVIESLEPERSQG
jgi:hypothetical protein